MASISTGAFALFCTRAVCDVRRKEAVTCQLLSFYLGCQWRSATGEDFRLATTFDSKSPPWMLSPDSARDTQVSSPTPASFTSGVPWLKGISTSLLLRLGALQLVSHLSLTHSNPDTLVQHLPYLPVALRCSRARPLRCYICLRSIELVSRLGLSHSNPNTLVQHLSTVGHRRFVKDRPPYATLTVDCHYHVNLCHCVHRPSPSTSTLPRHHHADRRSPLPYEITTLTSDRHRHVSHRCYVDCLSISTPTVHYRRNADCRSPSSSEILTSVTTLAVNYNYHVHHRCCVECTSLFAQIADHRRHDHDRLPSLCRPSIALVCTDRLLSPSPRLLTVAATLTVCHRRPVDWFYERHCRPSTHHRLHCRPANRLASSSRRLAFN